MIIPYPTVLPTPLMSDQFPRQPRYLPPVLRCNRLMLDYLPLIHVFAAQMLTRCEKMLRKGRVEGRGPVASNKRQLSDPSIMVHSSSVGRPPHFFTFRQPTDLAFDFPFCGLAVSSSVPRRAQQLRPSRPILLATALSEGRRRAPLTLSLLCSSIPRSELQAPISLLAQGLNG
jgi:hypothetical protein